MFKRKTGDKRPPVRAVNHLFHGIAIEPGETACEAVRQLAGRRFLSDEAPRLPLDECQCIQECRCTYRHFPDRRTQTRRDADMGLPQRDVPGDQRAGVGRRITDT